VTGLLRLLAGSSEANVSLVPSSGSLALDADTLSAPGASSAGLLSSDPEGAKALSELPGESWLAVGLGHLGASLPQDVEGLRALSALGAAPGPTSPEGTSTSTLSIKSLLAGALRKDGGSLRTVSIPGTEAAVGVALTGLPVVLDIADGHASDGHTKFVLGFGEASVEAALNPPSAMAAAPSHSAASSALAEGI